MKTNSKSRLTIKQMGLFDGKSLFDRIARAVCRAGTLPAKELYEAWEVARRVHDELKDLSPFYADLERLIEVYPLRATLLLPGTFHRLTQERQAAGADLAHLKPPHMNASDTVIADLLRLSETAG